MIDMVVDPKTTEYSYVRSSDVKSFELCIPKKSIVIENYYLWHGIQRVVPNRYFVWSGETLLDAYEKKEASESAPDISKWLRDWSNVLQVENKKAIMIEHDSVKHFIIGDISFQSEIKERRILDALRDTGLENIAEELNHLIKVVAKYPDVEGIDLNSMDSMARFFLENVDIPTPTIASDSDGIIGLEWRLPLSSTENEWNCDGILCMDFLPSGDIEFTGDAIATEEYPALDFGGGATHENVIDKIEEFLQRLR